MLVTETSNTPKIVGPALQTLLLAIERQMVSTLDRVSMAKLREAAKDRMLSLAEFTHALNILKKYGKSLSKNNLILPTLGDVWQEYTLGRITYKQLVPLKKVTSHLLHPLNSGAKVITWDPTGVLNVQCAYNIAAHTMLKALIYKFGGPGWNNKIKCWQLNKTALAHLVWFFPEVTGIGLVGQWIDYYKQLRLYEYYKRLEVFGPLSKKFQDGTSLMKHQQEGVQYILWWKNLIVADDLGLGKTLTTLAAASTYQLPIKIICPVSVQRAWEKEAIRLGILENVQIYTWNAIPEETSESPFVLCCDEAHYAQNFGAKRTKRMLTLAHKARNTILITGTPTKHGRPRDLLPLLQAIKHPLSYDVRKYQIHFCDAAPTQFAKWDTSGAVNLNELHEIIKPILLRRTKDECLDLPLKTRMFKSVVLDKETERLYQIQFDSQREAYRRKVAEKDTLGESVSSAEAMVMLRALHRIGSLAKVDPVTEVATEVLSQGHQCVIFTQYVDSAKLLATRFGVEPLIGTTPRVKRDMLVENFQQGKTSVFVGTSATGGLGITLTAGDVLLLVDRPYTPGDAIQAEDRIHRIGQNKNVLVIWFQLGKADAHVDEIVFNKQINVGTIVTGVEGHITESTTVEAIAPQLLEKIFDLDEK